MKRYGILLAIASLGTSMACGDDGDGGGDGDDDIVVPPDGGDAAMMSGPSDATTNPPTDAQSDGNTAPTNVKVMNPGAACMADRDCMGAGASCQQTFGFGSQNIPLQGGYCTASCETSAECGPGGGCPLAEATRNISLPGVDLKAVLPFPSNCLDKCNPREANDCREGYTCLSVRDVLPADFRIIAATLIPISVLTSSYCVPPLQPTAPPPDAGTSDAGTMSVVGLDGGLDAGI